MDGKEPMLEGPDFPTGGVVINKNDIPEIMRTGHGTIKPEIGTASASHDVDIFTYNVHHLVGLAHTVIAVVGHAHGLTPSFAEVVAAAVPHFVKALPAV